MRAVVGVAILVFMGLAWSAAPASASSPCGQVVFDGSILGRPDMWIEDRGADGLWIYEESGLAPGKQDAGTLAGVVTDPCGDRSAPDILLAHVPAT